MVVVLIRVPTEFEGSFMHPLARPWQCAGELGLRFTLGPMPFTSFGPDYSQTRPAFPECLWTALHRATPHKVWRTWPGPWETSRLAL